MKSSFFARVGTLLLFSATTIGAAHSAPFITDWSYKVTTEFTGAAFRPGEGSDCNVATATQLSWGGCPAGDPRPETAPDARDARSGITITNPTATGSMKTDGPAVDTGTIFTHFNHQTWNYQPALIGASAQMMLEITSLAPDTGTSFGPVRIPFDIFFKETDNAEPCVAASAVPCDDIFVLSGTLNREFEIGGELYYLSFFPTSVLRSLPKEVCEDAGSSYPCIGFTTEEDKATEVAFNMVITGKPVDPLTPVPEPGTLALLGVAGLGAWSMRRRRG